jgi:hypothetical protein
MTPFATLLPHRGPRRALWAAAWSGLLVVIAVALPLPVGGTGTTIGHQTMTSTTWSTLVAANGIRILVLLGIPLVLSVICGLSLQLSEQYHIRWASLVALTCVALTCAECLIGITSVGLLLIPAAVLLVWAYRSPRGVRS